jgi:hypothetical protein
LRDRGIDRQKKRLNQLKDLLRPWLPFIHFSEEAACELQGTTPEGVRLHHLKQFCGCEPESFEAAAKFLGLDHTSTPDCAVLASILAEVVFGSSPKRGAKRGRATEWNGPTLILLGRRYRELKTAHPKYSDSKIARIISEGRDFKSYRKNPNAIRKKLRLARAELFHMERDPGRYYFSLRRTGDNAIVKSLRWSPKLRAQKLSDN